MFTLNIPFSVRPATPVASGSKPCGRCGRLVTSGVFVDGTLSCPTCTGFADRNSILGTYPVNRHDGADPCADCPGNPAVNPGASGVCHCTLGNRKLGWAT